MAIPLVLLYLYATAIGILSKALCAAEPSDDKPVLYFTPTHPTQTPPVSTVWGGVETYYLNVVDCNYVTVQNVDHNPAQVGQFTTRTTSSVLTVVRVGCMTPTEIVTRIERNDFDALENAPMQTARPEAIILDVDQLEKRSVSDAATLKSLLNIAGRLSDGVDPTWENITLKEFRYLEELNTALFSLNIVNSGLPLDLICQYLQDPALEKPLSDSVINREVAGNIVCYAAKYGLYFGESNEELLADLAAMEYAIQTHAYGESLQETCARIQYDAASLLGVDVQGIAEAICNTTYTPSSTTASSNMPLVTGTGSATSSSWSVTQGPPVSFTGTGGSGSASPTGSPATSAGPWSNTTSTGTASDTSSWETESASRSPSFLVGSNGPAYSSATSAAGPGATWSNDTVVTITEPVLTVTADATAITPEPTATQLNAFYNPPRQLRDRLRRHGRDHL